MNTDALRKKILDLAIRGKLVPQDPDDEPASVLLECIRTEKQQMVKDGKLKKKDIKNDTVIYVGEDNLHYEKFQDGTVKCIEDEIPFELPEGWCWTRLASICIKVTDGTHHSPENYPTGEYKYITAKNVKSDGVLLDDITYVASDVHKEIFARCNPEFGDILYIKDGATSGIATVNTLREEFSMLSSVALLKPAQGIDNWYMCYAMQSPYFYATTRGDMKGVGITRITLNMLTSRLIPIAPKIEQQRISIKVRELICLVTNIESDKNNIIKVIANTKRKILDLAIRGELVPQNPDDEPASVLLERIRAEKEELIKQGKIKRDKKESVIFKGDDNSYYEKLFNGKANCINEQLPFELPEGWEWTRLGCISDAIQYGLSNSAETFGDYRLLRITDIQDGHVDWDSVPFTSIDEPEKYLLHKNDIIFARTGATVGKSFFITDLPYASVYASYLIRIRLMRGISPNYVYQFFNSNCYWKQVTSKAVGVGQPNCNGTSLKKLFVPLPSKAEQQRIVNKISELFESLGCVEESLN